MDLIKKILLDIDSFSLDYIIEFVTNFTPALIVIIGIIGFVNAITRLITRNNTEAIRAKAKSLVWQTLAIIASGFIWLNITWEQATAEVLYKKLFY